MQPACTATTFALLVPSQVSYGSAFPGWILMLAMAGIAFALIVVVVGHHSRDRKRRLDLIEQALRNPAISPEVQRELLHALRPAGWSRLVYAIGWFSLIGGIGWLCTDPHNREFQQALFLTIGGFALLTLPLVLRELEGKKA